MGRRVDTASRDAQGSRVICTRAASSFVSVPKISTDRQAVTKSWNSSSSSLTFTCTAAKVGSVRPDATAQVQLM